MVTAICRGKPMKYMGEGEGEQIVMDQRPMQREGGVGQDCFKSFAITETGISRGTEGGQPPKKLILIYIILKTLLEYDDTFHHVEV